MSPPPTGSAQAVSLPPETLLRLSPHPGTLEYYGILNGFCGLCLQEKYVEELATVRQTLQTDLETSIRRIADLQAALEEVVSSDSDTER